MPTLINSFTLPTAYIPGNNATFSLAQNNVIFVTYEGLLGVYTKTNLAGGAQNKVGMFNPSLDTVTASPIAEWPLPTQWAAGYSATHRAMVGVPTAQGLSASSLVKKINLVTGVESQIGIINMSATGTNDNNADQGVGVAYDGTYLHYLKGNGIVYMMEIVTGTLVRSYSAPFGTSTTGIHYDGNGNMFFSGGWLMLNHVAKLQIPVSGTGLVDAPIVGAWKIATFNDNVQTYYNKATTIGWDGRAMLFNRHGVATAWRYDLTNDPYLAIISPLPARLATNASAGVFVKVVDDVGQLVPGATVDLAIDNSGGPTFGSVLPATAVTNANGEATFTYTAGNTPGTDNLKATVRY